MGTGRSLPLNRPYDTDGSNVRHVSNDSLVRALDFLDAKSLAAVCETSRRFRDIGHTNDRVWDDELKRVFRHRLISIGPQPAAPAAAEIVGGGGHEPYLLGPKPMGPAKRTFVHKAKQASTLIQTKYDQDLLAYRRSGWSCWYRCLAEALVFPIVAILFLLGTIMVMLGFSQGTVTALHLVPWLVLCGFILVFFILQCYIKWAESAWGSAPPFERGTWTSNGLGFLIDDMLAGEGLQNVHGFFVFIIFLTFEVLFLLRAADVITISWHIVFIPCWLVFLNVCCLPLWPMMWDESCRERLSIWLITTLISAPSLAFAIMLLLKLEHGFLVPGGLRLAYVLIPGFFGEGLLCLISVVFSCSERKPWGVGLYCLCIGPLIAFEVVLVLFVDSGDPSQVTGTPIILAFIPLLCFLCMCNVGACVGCAQMDRPHSRRKPSRDTWAAGVLRI